MGITEENLSGAAGSLGLEELQMNAYNFGRDRETMERAVTVIHDDDARTVYLVRTSEFGLERMEVEKRKPQPARIHTFLTVEGLCDYLMSEHTKDDHGIVFVGETQVFADLNYKGRNNESSVHKNASCRMRLKPTPEFQTLSNLFGQRMSQSEFWRALVTDFKGLLPDELLLQVSTLRKNMRKDDEVKIDYTGTMSGSVSKSVTIETDSPRGEGTKETQINVEPVWIGRVYQCIHDEYHVPLRLEITEEPLGFILHPVRVKEVLEQARRDVITQIRDRVDRFDIFEGEDESAPF